MSRQLTSHAAGDSAGLPRVLGASQATAIVVGTIVGSGIFLVPREMMQDLGSSALVYLAWIAGGLLSLFGAMTYAELSAMLPYAGGEYVYLRGAYGDTIAFLYMWTWFAVAKPASIAAVTIGLARTLEFFPAFKGLSANALGGPLPLLWSQLFAIAVTWLITGLNYLGIKKAADFQLVFTVLKVVLILIVAGFCFASPSGAWANFSTTLPHAVGGIGGFMAALIATLWSYDGWNDLTMVAGEIRRPERSLPIALIGGLCIVGALFMATNAAIQYVLPAVRIAASERPAVAALTVVAGTTGAGFVAAAMAAQHLCHPQRNSHVRRAHPLCRRPRPPLLPPIRGHSPALPVAFHIAGRPGTALHHPAALPQPFSAVFRTGGLCRVALLHADGHNRLRLSPKAARCATPISSLGLPAAPGHLYRQRRGRSGIELCKQPERLADGHGAHPAGAAGAVVRAPLLWSISSRTRNLCHQMKKALNRQAPLIRTELALGFKPGLYPWKK